MSPNKTNRAAVIKGSVASGAANKKTEPSLLARLNTAVHWALHFKLQHFHMTGLRELKLSAMSRSLIIDLNQTTDELKDSLQADYDTHKAEILAARKSNTEAFDIAAREAKK